MIPTEFLLLGLDSLILTALYTKYRDSELEARKVKAASEFEISKNLITKVAEAPDQILPYICLSGSVVSTTNKPIRSPFANEKVGVIQILKLQEHRSKRSQGFWTDATRTLRNIVSQVPFALAGEKPEECQIEVKCPMEAAYIQDNLTVTYDHYERNQEGFLERGIDRLAGDVSKGFQETEQMLLVGTNVLAIGKLNLQDDKLTLEPPENGLRYIVTSLSKLELVRRIENTSSLYRALLVIFGITGLGIIYVYTKGCYQRWLDKKSMEELQRKLRDNRRERSASDNSDSDDSNCCIVCLTNPREIVLLNCGHICICGDCAEKLPLPRTCPVCRAKVERMVPTFIA